MRFLDYVGYGALFVALLDAIFPLHVSRRSVEIALHRGETPYQLARKLRDSSIIRFEKLYLGLLKIAGRDRNILPGKYRFHTRGNELFAFWETINQTPEPIYVEVTIPPGLRATDVARILHSKMGIDTLRFMQLVRDEKFIRNLAVEFPHLDGVRSLEGFLYPDTYRFEEGSGEAAILYAMVKNFFDRWRRMGMDTLLKGAPLGFYESVILASIVEKEAVSEDEKPIISSVFINRLRRKMPLQANPTIWYITGRSAYWLKKSDLKIDSPYNTYLHPGLPPTPICNPTMSTIRAVLRPARTPYLYFVADGKGRHIFSRTYREHLRNIWRLKNRPENN